MAALDMDLPEFMQAGIDEAFAELPRPLRPKVSDKGLNLIGTLPFMFAVPPFIFGIIYILLDLMNADWGLPEPTPDPDCAGYLPPPAPALPPLIPVRSADDAEDASDASPCDDDEEEKGERIMDMNFGAGLRTYFFESMTNNTYPQIAADIEEQVKKYMPFIQIDSINFTAGDESAGTGNVLGVAVTYTILPLQAQDEIKIQESAEAF